MKKEKSFFYWMDKLEDMVLGVGFIAIIFIAFLQVVMRNVFNNSLSWSEELVRYVYIWLCWIGISLAERRGEHIRLTFIVERFAPVVRRVIEILVYCILAAVSLWLIYQGGKLVISLRAEGSISTALKIPMYIIYISMPVGCCLYAIRVFANLLAQIKAFGKKEA